MLTAYKARLVGNQIEWEQDRPADLPPGRAVPVLVTILEEPVEATAPADQGRRMAEALAKLAEIDELRHIIPYPIEWQREQRRERPLPERDQ